MQYTEIFSAVKKNLKIIVAQNIDCECTLQPPQRVPTYYVLDKK